jgi:hypothetical protein
MTTRDLRVGITRRGAAAVAAVAVGGGLVGGLEGAAGVIAGGAVAVLGFRRLATLVDGVAAGPAARGLSALGSAALRHVAMFAGLALVVATGWGHPLGVAAGVAVLPPLLLVEGLRGAGPNAVD